MNLTTSFNGGGPFSLNISSDGKSLLINKNSLILNGFNVNDTIEIANIDSEISLINISNEPNIIVWVEVDLNNENGSISAALKSGNSGWPEFPQPYKKNTSDTSGYFNGQTKIYALVASVVPSADFWPDDGIRYGDDYLIYRYLRQDLMVTQFCDIFMLIPIGSGFRGWL
jgi:hypothetical protein